ncbi:MAG: 2-5 ligase [Frankiales bacterium]|nr:2-5 ligase [Frankiales bacterium]
MRLFVCLRPPAGALADLVWALPAGPWPSERWHVTLAFLGEVAGPTDVEVALHQVVSPLLPLSLAGSGTFGDAVWVGLAGDVDGLRRLATQVRDACRAAGVAVEHRAFRPHLTVARRRRLDPAVLASYAGPTWTASELELVHSRLGRPVVHETVARQRLG